MIPANRRRVGPVSIPAASIDHDQTLTFAAGADVDRVWQLGIFYLEVPEALNLETARTFGTALLDPTNPYRDVPHFGELEGFIALDNNQQTKLALRRHRWDQYYPPQIAEFGRQLDAIGVSVMQHVLSESGIPKPMWQRASGGYSSGGGTAFLNFVHYDTRHSYWGLRPHTDYGFVTILDATAPGLQVDIDGVFVDVPVRPGYLAIHFGEALSYITAYGERQATAVRHRVLSQRDCDPIRHGIVYFANPDLDGMVCQVDAHGHERGSSSVVSLFERLERDLTELA